MRVARAADRRMRVALARFADWRIRRPLWCWTWSRFPPHVGRGTSAGSQIAARNPGTEPRILPSACFHSVVINHCSRRVTPLFNRRFQIFLALDKHLHHIVIVFFHYYSHAFRIVPASWSKSLGPPGRGGPRVLVPLVRAVGPPRPGGPVYPDRHDPWTAKWYRRSGGDFREARRSGRSASLEACQCLYPPLRCPSRLPPSMPSP
jgi:hypothetical protein